MSTPPPESTDQTLTDEDDSSESDSLPPTPRRTPPPPPPGWARRRTGAPPAALQIATAKLLTCATTGRLNDAHKTLCQYMASHTAPNPTTGLLELPEFHQSITAAIANNHPALLSYLFYMRIGDPSSYVDDAVKARSTAIFQVFLDHKWDINEPLPRADGPALTYITHDEELTKWFLDNGANPNALFAWGLTPMSEAMRQASFGTIELLFARGADIQQGQLLHNAVLRDGPEFDVIKILTLLLDKGAPIDEIQYQNHQQSFHQLQDFSLGTPLHYAAEAGKGMVVSYLLAQGAERLIKNTKGMTAIEIAKDSEVVKILSQ